jgi:hypothetical protein
MIPVLFGDLLLGLWIFVLWTYRREFAWVFAGVMNRLFSTKKSKVVSGPRYQSTVYPG